MNKKIIQKLALFISAIFTPPLVAGLAIAAISLYYSDRFQNFWQWALAGIFLLIGPASIYVLWGFKKGNVSNIALSEREQRLRPLGLSLIGAVIGTLITLKLDAPTSIKLLGLILVCELVIVIFVTLFWKISLHALTLSSVITLLAYLYNQYAFILLILLIPVGWARIYRKRHTPLQVVAGTLVGIFTALAVFMMFNYPAK